MQSSSSLKEIGMNWETSEPNWIQFGSLLIPRDGKDLKFSWDQDATKSSIKAKQDMIINHYYLFKWRLLSAILDSLILV